MASGESTDLAARTKHFRNSLIEEFRLSESDTSIAFEAPKYSSDAFRNPHTVSDILRHKPHTLIKFKIFKRSKDLTSQNSTIQTQDRTRKKPGRLQRAKTNVTMQAWATWLSTHRHFSTFIICAIFLNAVVLGIQTFLDPVEDWRFSHILDILDHITIVIFVQEIILKWISNFWDFWKDGWNNFDFFVTAGSLVPLIAQSTILAGESSSNAQNFAGVAKSLRIFRTFRTLKMIAKFRSLRIIVRTIIEALQSLGFVLVLLFLLMYIFAVLAVTLFSDYATSTIEGLVYQENFRDMITSFRTLFQLLTLDQWYNIAQEISRVPTINMIVTISYFVVWVALGAFIFRNIFIGVMVKNFQSISQELTQLDQASKKKARLQKYARELHDQMEEKKKKSLLKSLNESEEGGTKSPNSATTEESRSAVEADKQSPAESLSFNSRESTRKLIHDANEDADKAAQWRKFVSQSIHIFKEQDPGATLWPRDTLLDYLQTMERLQENMKEFQELQHLAALALYNVVTDS